jgi:PPOX class probable F420-dependent enzyme
MISRSAAVDERAHRFLSAPARRTAHLATVSGRGEPQVLPICFVLIDQTIYLAIDEKPKRDDDPYRLRRLRNIAENPRVAVVADVYDDADWRRLGFVMVRGSARVVGEREEHARAVGALRGKYGQYEAMALDDRPVVAIDVDQTVLWGELEGSS